MLHPLLSFSSSLDYFIIYISSVLLCHKRSNVMSHYPKHNSTDETSKGNTSYESERAQERERESSQVCSICLLTLEPTSSQALCQSIGSRLCPLWYFFVTVSQLKESKTVKLSFAIPYQLWMCFVVPITFCLLTLGSSLLPCRVPPYTTTTYLNPVLSLNSNPALYL